MDVFGDEGFRRQDDAAEAAALAVDMLGRGIDHDVGAERERALPDRRGEHVVDDQPRAGLMRDLGDRRDVEHVERRIGRAFQEAAPGVRPHRLLPLVEIEAVDQRGLRCRSAAADLPPRSGRSRTSPSPPPHGRRLSAAPGWPWSPRPCRWRWRARLRAPSSSIMRRSNIAIVGIGKARIEIAGILALEARLALFGAVVDKALGQKQRFGCFAELRAQRAGMDQPGFGTVTGGGRCG